MLIILFEQKPSIFLSSILGKGTKSIFEFCLALIEKKLMIYYTLDSIEYKIISKQAYQKFLFLNLETTVDSNDTVGVVFICGILKSCIFNHSHKGFLIREFFNTFSLQNGF